MTGPLIWLNACEPSGDMHGALLANALKELHPGIRLAGMGGPAMDRQHVGLSLRMESLSVMGVSEVFAYLPRILAMWRMIRRELVRLKPTAIVLIDSPDFHFHIVRMASRMSIPIFYYISPQVWAWRRGRVAFLRKYVRRMLCILPFEQDFYRTQGMAAEYVGHPLVEELRRPEIMGISPNEKRVGILPGSRKSEIDRMMPVFAEAAANLLQRDPGLEICIFKAPGVSEAQIRRHCPAGLPLLFLDARDRYAHMRSCILLLATSGTATLESSLLGVPTIVAYKCSWLNFLIGIRLVRVPAVSLTNLILRQNVLPEYLQHQASPANLSNKAWQWLTERDQLERVRQELERLGERLGSSAMADTAGEGASKRAARVILRDIGFVR